MIARPKRSEVGLPEACEVVQVLHNRAAKQTIIEVRLAGGSPIHRLYWRSLGQLRYEPLCDAAPSQSFEHAITCERPLAFMRAVEWKPSGKGMGGSTLGLWRAELTDPPLVSPIDLAKTLLPANAHVSKLIRANDEGTNLLAVVAFREDGPVRYAICGLDLSNHSAVEFDTLPGIFF